MTGASDEGWGQLSDERLFEHYFLAVILKHRKEAEVFGEQCIRRGLITPEQLEKSLQRIEG